VSFSQNDGVLVCITADNSAISGAISISSVSDSQSNTYTLIRNVKTQGGSINNLASAAIYLCAVTNAISTSDSITVNFSPNTPSKAVVIYKIACASGKKPSNISSGATAPVSDSTSLSRSTVTIPANDTVFMVAGIETNESVTADTDTLRGSWSSAYSATADTGTLATSMQVVTQYKTVTSSGTQTWNLSWATSTSYCAAYASITEVAALSTVTKTATGSGSGTATAAIKVTQLRLGIHTDFSFGFINGAGRFYIGSPTIVRTATGSGQGTETATPFPIRVRTATGTSTSDSTAIGLHIAPRTATATGSGTQSATPLRIVERTASDAAQPFRTNLIPNPSFESGTSDWLALNSATISQSSAQAWRDVYSLSVTTSTTFFSGISTDFIPATAGVRYTVSWYARSATGSVGSMRPALLVFDSSNTQLTSGISFSRTFTTTWTRFSMSLTAPANTASIKFRLDNTQNVGGLVFYVDGVLLEAADSAGTYFEGSIGANAPLGSSTAVVSVASGRTATGDATGTSTAESSFFSIVTTTATGSGVGSGLGLFVFARLATGSGVGSSVVVGARINGRAGTSTGTGTGTADWTKSRIFRMPADDEYPGGLFANFDTNHRLRSYDRSGRRARNLYKLTNGTYTTTEQRDQGQVAKVYLGSHSNFLTDTEVSELTAAGYGSYIT
jgi:hypothetical protein